jgi:hypothetical protein
MRPGSDARVHTTSAKRSASDPRNRPPSGGLFLREGIMIEMTDEEKLAAAHGIDPTAAFSLILDSSKYLLRDTITDRLFVYRIENTLSICNEMIVVAEFSYMDLVECRCLSIAHAYVARNEPWRARVAPMA